MADKRISGLTALTTISKDDILLVVDDPAGTPTNKKISIEKFFSNVEPQIVFANVTAASNSTAGSVTFRGGVGVSKNLIIDGNVSVNGVFTLTGNGAITNLSSNLTPDTTITYDLGNSTASWKDVYVKKIVGHSGSIELSANATLSANLTTTGANVYVNGTDLTVDANTTLKANLIVHSDSTNTVINSGNTHITSNTLLAGTNTVISSNLSSSANLTQTGALSLFNGANLTSNANATFFGNVSLGVTSGGGNPKGADTALLKIDAGNTISSSNTTIQGTNTVISSNVTMTGANVNITGSNNYITANTTLTANLSITGANVHINPAGVANVYIKGNITTTGNTALGDDLSVAGNVNVTDVTDSSSNTTGSIVTAGGIGVKKNVRVGGNLTVHGNIHANGNITADGGTVTLGDSASDTVEFNADLGSHLIPSADSTYDLGTNSDRYRFLYVDDVLTTGNVNVSGDMTATGNVSGAFANFTDNVKIATDKSLQLRDATEFIKSNADGEITVASATKVTVTTTSLNTTANTTLAGQTANVTANLFISGANSIISSANTTLSGTKTTVSGTSLVVTANTSLPQFTSNTILVTTGANTNLGGSVNISGNVEMSGTANVAGNTHIGGKLDQVGNVTMGTTGAGAKVTIHANNDILLNSNGTTNFIKLDTKRTELYSNVNLDIAKHILAGNGVYVQDGTSVVFGGQMTIDDTTTTEGTLLLEDGTAAGSGTDNGSFILEDGATDRIASNSTGLIFGGDMILDGTEISSANGVVNLGTYNGVANGVIRISDAYNLPNTAGSNGQFLRLLNGNLTFSSGTGVNMVDLEDDTSPQLGGKLDTNGQVITNDAQANVVIHGNTSVSASAGVKLGSHATLYTFVKDSNGRLGINTTNPSKSLEVVGTFSAANDSEFRQNLDIALHNGSDVGLQLGGTLITSTAAEINKLDGFTGDVADLNKISGTSDTLSSADIDAVENFEQTVSSSTDTLTIKDGNICLDVACHDLATYGLKLAGTLVTSSAAELNILDGCLADVNELNKLQIVNDGQTQVSRFLHTDSENRIDFTALDGSKPGQVTVANVVVTGTTTSSSNTTGALKVTGGAGIAKSVNVGQKLTVHGNTVFNSNVTMSATVAGNQIFYDKTADSLSMKIRAVGIGTTSLSTGNLGSANNVLAIGNGVAPTSLPDGQAYLYAKDVSGETHIHTMDEGGNETKLGPHNEEGEWEFYSRNTKTGKVTRINMERMIRKLEEFTGETFIEHE
tara:strand:+ start:711 stop:4448 length:3738 start_codon:yes stop_codon:yes gene_type:complete